jgi:hypothetical protein
VVCWAGDHTAVDAIAAGLEAFYERFGWTVVGTWPSALQIAPGDRRDECSWTSAWAREGSAQPGHDQRAAPVR